MRQLVRVQKDGSNQYADIVLDLPSVCPHCNGKMNPTVWEAITPSTYNEAIETIGVLAQCITCLKFFALEFDDSFSGEMPYEHNRLVPYSYNPLPETNFDEIIHQLSPDFVEIYSQALSAEQNKLDRIAGIGYRRALEFLVKDFCIYKNPEAEQDIKEKSLGNVIKKYLAIFPKIQTLAEASSWIGNDEAHYVKKHSDRDIKDLKNFLSATQHFIVAELSVDDAFNLTSK